jgi:hypothetical protein
MRLKFVPWTLNHLIAIIGNRAGFYLVAKISETKLNFNEQIVNGRTRYAGGLGIDKYWGKTK